MTGSILDRIRAADPVPGARSAENTGLFAQITSLPPDPRLERWTRRHRRLVLALAAAFGALVLLSSTALALNEWVLFGAEGVSPQVTKSEYLNAQKQLSLPPGYSWPAFSWPANTRTGPGGGGSMAVEIAITSWEHYWVKAIQSGDTSAQKRAHDELTLQADNNVIVAPSDLPENGGKPQNPPKGPYAVYASDGGLQSMRKAWDQAADGNPQDLIEICRANPWPDDRSIAIEQVYDSTTKVSPGETAVLRFHCIDRGTADIAATVAIKLDDATVKTISLKGIAPNTTTACSFTVTLAPGTYTWSVRAKDADGRVSEPHTDPQTLTVE